MFLGFLSIKMNPVAELVSQDVLSVLCTSTNFPFHHVRYALRSKYSTIRNKEKLGKYGFFLRIEELTPPSLRSVEIFESVCAESVLLPESNCMRL